MIRRALAGGAAGRWSLDVATGDLRWSKEMTALFGLPEDQAPGDVPGFLALVHPDDRERVLATGRRVLSGEQGVVRHQFRAVWPDGSEHWLADEARRVDGAVAGTTLDLGSAAEALERYAFLLDAGQAIDAAASSGEAVQRLVELIAERFGEVAFAVLGDTDPLSVTAWHASLPELAEPLRDFAGLPIDPHARGGVAEALRTGRSALHSAMRTDYLRARVADPAAWPVLERVFAGRDAAIVPLLAGDEVIGAVLLARRGAPFGEDDVTLMEDLGRRAGLALQNRRLLERAVEARARLDELIEAAPIGIGFFDTDLRYVRLNAELEAINGMPAEAHLGRRPSEVLPAGGPEVEAMLARVLADGQARSEEITVAVPGDPPMVRDFIVGWYRVRPAGGEPTGIGATIFEITARKRAERELQAQRDLYAGLIEAQESVGEAVFVLTGQRFRWGNAAALELAGRSAEALAALPSVVELVAPEDRAAVAAHLEAIASSGSAVRFEARMLRPDGRVVWAELAGRALLAEGEPSILGIGRDITERKEAELERERTHRRTVLLADLSTLLEASLDLRALLGGAARLLVQRELAGACAFEVVVPGGRWERVAQSPERGDLDGDAEHPLVAGGEVVGRLLADAVAAEDRGLLAELAARIAPVVVNARLYEERERVARTLQRSLLPPRLPEIPGVGVASRYAPGAARLDVGGDFYDLFATGPATWSAVVGDVCGKGAEAAAMTALARHTLRALAQTSTDPADMLRSLGAAIVREHADLERFITVVLARVVPREHGLRLDVGCAGHPPPVVLRGSGAVEEVAARGPLLGVGAPTPYTTAHVDLRPGDVAVLYTDGLSEAGRSLHDRGWHAVAAEHRAAGAEAVAAALEAWARAQSRGDDLADDLALLVLRA